MKILLSILILTFSLQSWSKADDIRDFEIEGISVGDNVLNYYSKDYIDKNKGYIYKNKKYFAFYKSLSNSMYDGLEFHLSSDYIIQSLAGKIFFDDNIVECHKKMNLIEKEVSILFPEATIRKQNRKHRADPSGKSTIKDIAFFLKSGEAIQVSCNDWSKFKNKTTGEIKDYSDELKVSLYTSVFIDFLNEENY